ncbi:ribulose-phosphate 3-epimerase [bacterium]|nr:ribulose-phosphate 3-epimerase [bacterium]
MHLADQIHACEQGGADCIHCDIMDGHFVPNLTFGPPIIKQLSQITELKLDVHLMIEEPEKSLESYVKAGAHEITVHQEVSPHLHRTLHRIKEFGAQAGVSLNPSTPVDLLEPVIEDMDLLLFMSVNPGFGGQSFLPNVLKKIETAKQWKEQGKGSFIISVDGGIDKTTAKSVVDAGADRLVAGTAVFKGSIPENIRILRESV